MNVDECQQAGPRQHNDLSEWQQNLLPISCLLLDLLSCVCSVKVALRNCSAYVSIGKRGWEKKIMDLTGERVSQSV